jgi:phospholipid N-methyltransferase
MQEMALQAVRIGCTLANVPPAFVYRIRRASSGI